MVDQLFHPASNQVETIEKVCVTVACIRTTPRSYCVPTVKAREVFIICMRRIKAETGFLVPDFDFVQSFSEENWARREIIQM